MTDKRWAEVDAYIGSRLVEEDRVLRLTQDAAKMAGLPPIAVSPAQGKFLYLTALQMQANRILEVGTLAGYSAIWMARALPAWGKLVTLEIDRKHAEVSRANIENAKLDKVVDVIEGPALQLLDRMEGPPFDLVFIDADKENNAAYFEHAYRMTRKGAIIIVDNVVRDGAVTDPNGSSQVQGVRKLFDLIRDEPRVSATVIQTVGEKGYDGFLMAVVLEAWTLPGAKTRG
jgi:predicted O-methyltransferase YrrM